MEAKAAVLHFLPIHVDGKEAGYEVEEDGACDCWDNQSRGVVHGKETYYSKF